MKKIKKQYVRDAAAVCVWFVALFAVCGFCNYMGYAATLPL